MRKLLHKSLLSTIHFRQSYVLKNARIVNADLSEQGDVLIENGKIAQISSSITHKTAEVIDCTNKLVIPGGIDTHTHMQLPFMGAHAVDDFDIGSKAAIAGGTTSFIDFAIPSQTQSMSVAYDRWRGWADPKVNCDYALHATITSWNDQTPGEMKRMVEEHGINSFKFFMAYKGALSLDDVSMYKAFETARDLGALCIVHAQNGDIISQNQQKLLKKGITGPEGHYLSRPQSVEAEAVHRVITIAEHANVPLYIVHLMSRQASEEVLRARNRGLLVYGETLAATIGTDGSKLFDKDWDVAARYVMSPSLNPDPKVKTQIMKYLNSGVIDVVGTDNCTFCTETKRIGQDNFAKIPNGVNGLQDRLSLVWTKGVKAGLLSENQFVQKTSSRAAQIFNMYPRKGIIRVGADADVVVWDPNFKKTITAANHHHKVDFNIFEGQQVYGKADYSFSNGNLVWNGKTFLNQQKGKYIKRHPFGFVYGRHKAWTETNDPIHLKVDRRTPTQSESKTASSPQQVKIEQLQAELKRVRQERDQLLSKVQKQAEDISKDYNGNQLINSYESLEKHLPPRVFESVRQIFYGNRTEQVPLKNSTKQLAQKKNIQVKSFRIGSIAEELRAQRRVKVAAIQSQIVLPTSEPVKKQKWAILERTKEIIEVAALEGANIVCLQEIFNAPFFMCTRERYPWVEFSESMEGESIQFLKELAKKHNMVIIPSILEREKNKQTLHNSSVYIDNHGDVLGKQEKGHIPRVGDFNESTYYMEGQSGHPVYETEFGRIGSNICYGRHHPLHWMGFGLNGAEIVVNPAATINGLSEPLWPIEGRNAAVANHYFTVNINRIGTEVYPHVFTSGDKKGPKREFGHFYGSSYVAAPDGSRTPGLSRTNDGVLITEIDLNMCRQIKDVWGFTMTGRHKLYAELLTKYSTFDFEPQIVRKNNKK